MAIDRPRSTADGVACAGLALGALILTAAPDAAADGERTPMLGAALVGGRGPEARGELVGGSLEVAWWWGRLGVALEGASRWKVDDGARATALGASARLRVHESMLPALLERRDVELGVELHGIVERTWWSGDAPEALEDGPIGYGLGLAVRLRGGSDDDEFSALLAESRLFVRVLSARRTVSEAAARAMPPVGGEDRTRELTILFGLGAAFGAGEPRYLDRFRLRPLEVPLGR